MTTFDTAFAIVVGIEGDLSLDPNDPGNYRNGVLVGTKYGISAKANPDVDIANLTLDGAKLLYYQRYWFPAGCDLMPPRAALCMLDAAVNQGCGTAILLMQKACGIAYDGLLGERTRAEWAVVTDVQLAKFMSLRTLWYVQNKNFAIYGSGWVDRMFTVCFSAIA